MTGSNRSKMVGMSLAAPAVLGGAWMIRRLMSSSNGALAHEDPEGGKREKVEEVLKKTAHPSGFQPGAMPEPMQRQEGPAAGGGARARLQDVKETAAGSVGQIKDQARDTAGDVVRQAGEAAHTARESAMTAAPGMLSWARRNTKIVTGMLMSAFALISLMRWRRGRKAGRGEAGESVAGKQQP